MTLQPSRSRTTAARRMLAMVMIQEGRTLQFLWRKVRDSWRSIFSSWKVFATLLENYLNCLPSTDSDMLQLYIPMDFSYENYYNQMNQTYYSIYNWPQPYHYQLWYHQLTQAQQSSTLHPTQYTQIYTYTMQNASNINRDTSKLSRNQKRKMKKKELQEELERETKAIGKWVKLERKDLIENIERLEKQEEKMKKKKDDKLGHLIQINKQVAKQYRKKEGSAPAHRRVDLKKAKKRVSYIKQMKEVFQSNKPKILGLSPPQKQQWISDSQQDEQIQTQNKQKKVQSEKKEIVPIEYKNIGKLTGRKHNNMVLREWVTNYPSEVLNDLVLRVVNRLAYKQAIRKAQKPQKAKKLIVSGMKECKRTITTIIDKKRSKMLIVALNIERNPYKGGVDDQVQTVIQLAQQLKIPIIHACSRSHLGRAFTGKWGPRLTMVSIINYEGYQDNIEEMMKEWEAARQKYDLLP